MRERIYETQCVHERIPPIAERDSSLRISKPYTRDYAKSKSVARRGRNIGWDREGRGNRNERNGRKRGNEPRPSCGTILPRARRPDETRLEETLPSITIDEPRPEKGSERKRRTQRKSKRPNRSRSRDNINFEEKEKLEPLKQKLKIAHLNCNGLLAKRQKTTKLNLLIAYMTATNIDILSINEHHTNENDIIPPNNTYEWVGSPCLEGKRKAGGTGFLIRRTLNWKLIDSLPDDCQKLFIEVDSNGKRLLVGSFYLPQRCDTEIDHFGKLLQKTLENSQYDQVLIMGDANAWHPSWSPHSNERGVNLAKYIHSNKLHVLPIAGPTRLGHGRQRDSYIDLFITDNDNIASMTPYLDYEFNISDHRLQSLEISLGRLERRRIINFRATLKSEAMVKINDAIENTDWDSIFKDIPLEEIPDCFNARIEAIWKQYAIYKHVDSQSKPFWTKTIKRKRRLARYWERQLKRFSGTLQYEMKLIKGHPMTRESVKIKHKQCLDDFHSSLVKIKEKSERHISKLLQRKLFHTVRKIEGKGKRSIPPILKPGGSESISDDREKATIFNKLFSENCKLPRKFPKKKSLQKEAIKHTQTHLKHLHINTRKIKNKHNHPRSILKKQVKSLTFRKSRLIRKYT